jgi:hypothetical protein
MVEKSAEQARKERLARQLRDNLRRRKAQARGLARSRAQQAPGADKGRD